MQETRPDHKSSVGFGDLPVELVQLILARIPQKSLVKLLQTCRSIYKLAIPFIYKEPHFASTYRFAQFVDVVAHKKDLAELVLMLDLSGFGGMNEGLEKEMGKLDLTDEGSEVSQGREGRRDLSTGTICWDFQYLTREILSPYQSGSCILEANDTSYDPIDPKMSNPPSCSTLRRQWHQKEIPAGILCHVLTACQNLEVVDFTRLNVKFDLAILHPASHGFQATTWTDLLFVSDFAAEVTGLEESHTQWFDIKNIVKCLINLPHLRTFVARDFEDIRATHVGQLVFRSETLENVDFTGAGLFAMFPMFPNLADTWARKGTKDEIKEIIKTLESHPPSPQRFGISNRAIMKVKASSRMRSMSFNFNNPNQEIMRARWDWRSLSARQGKAVQYSKLHMDHI